MINWIFKGILRDKTRSLFPFLVVTVGVALMIALLGFMEGVIMDMLDTTANLDTGHLRFVNKPFYEEEHLIPMDRALAAQSETQRWLNEHSPRQTQWIPMIRWSAIMDVPDEKGDTLRQTPVTGMAIDLLSINSEETKRLNLEKALTAGRLPRKKGEILLGSLLAESLKAEIDRPITLIGQSFDGGLAADNYVVVGFVRFGVFAMDKKMALIDLQSAQLTFYMENMVTDWLGFLPPETHFSKYPIVADKLKGELKNWRQPNDWAEDDQPIVVTILEQRGIGEITSKFNIINGSIIGIFTFLMVLVLWNAGLLNGIHRQGEMGLRLALGESHKHLFISLLGEAFIIGTLGSIAGCIFGGTFVYYLQEVGVNMGDSLSQTGLMLSDVARARMSLHGFIQGIIPGMTANVLGTLAASIMVLKKSEADLFRELEAG